MTLQYGKFVHHAPFQLGRNRQSSLIRKTPRAFHGRAVGRYVWQSQISTTGVSPEVLSIDVLSGTTIRVHFAFPAANNVALANADNYTIDPPLAVHSVTPEAVTNPTYVVLITDEQMIGQVYTLTMQRIVKA